MTEQVAPRKPRIASKPRNSHVSATSPLGAESVHFTRIAMQYRRLEPRKPLTVVNNNPVFNDVDAASILGVSRDILKKLRQRDQGPDYIQYGENGSIRYEFGDLLAYKEAHKVHMANKQMVRKARLSGAVWFGPKNLEPPSMPLGPTSDQ